jgi:hypothetical protein
MLLGRRAARVLDVDLDLGHPGNATNGRPGLPDECRGIIPSQQECERHTAVVPRGQVPDHTSRQEIVIEAGVLDLREGGGDLGFERPGHNGYLTVPVASQRLHALHLGDGLLKTLLDALFQRDGRRSTPMTHPAHAEQECAILVVEVHYFDTSAMRSDIWTKGIQRLFDPG